MINDKTAELAIEAALSKGGDFAEIFPWLTVPWIRRSAEWITERE